MSQRKSTKNISLILPCYNIERYLPDCFRSILAQQGIEKCQVICVNDGSSDSTTKIIEKYVKKYPDIIQTVQNKNNMGVSTSRNVGLDLVRGNTVMFVDGDDLIGGRPDALNRIDRYYLEEFYDTMMSNPDCGMVVGNMIFVEADADCLINTNRTEEMTKILKAGKTSHDKALDFLDRRISSCATLYRTNMIQKYNLRFRPQMIYFEDTDFITRYSIACTKEYKYIWTPTAEPTYYFYRRRPNSAMMKLSRHSEKFIRRLERSKNRLVYYATLMKECEQEFGSQSRAFNIATHRYINTQKTMERYATRANKGDYSRLCDYIPYGCIGCCSHDCSICPVLPELRHLRNMCMKDLSVQHH